MDNTLTAERLFSDLLDRAFESDITSSLLESSLLVLEMDFERDMVIFCAKEGDCIRRAEVSGINDCLFEWVFDNAAEQSRNPLFGFLISRPERPVTRHSFTTKNALSPKLCATLYRRNSRLYVCAFQHERCGGLYSAKKKV